MINLYNYWHLGDCLLSLLYQRKLHAKHGIASRLYCEGEYMFDLRNYNGPIEIFPLSSKPHNAINSWVGRIFFQHPLRRSDYVQVMLDLYKKISVEAKVDNPIPTRDDMWFDFKEFLIPNKLSIDTDALVVNSEGRSNQSDHKGDDFIDIALFLHDMGYNVATTERINGFPCTRDYGLSLAGIGSIAGGCRIIVGNQTAPLHPTFTRWNKDRCQWVCIHKESFFNMGPMCHRASNPSDALKILKQIA